ncbi:hypothetical protein GIB67_006013 [Kingdonia uniflora]|uniref:Mitochondrial transcription termination factor family protein n=1 Tax=Kingdonia uniflora TaxID=39325 RepID=A0A7J7MBW7_9MAGN|nr:hypothetical protein GIB67_006013 [Kingdonia uniflora]
MYSLCKNTLLRRSRSIRRLISPFSSNAQIQNPSPIVLDYLVNTFGFSTDKAIKASKYFSRSASPSSLSIVPDYFKQSLGFSDAQITNIIFKNHKLLSSNLENTLKPKLKCLEHLGFSASSIAHLISANPVILHSDIDNTIIPTIEFLRSLQLSDQHIIKVLRRCNWLITLEFQKNLSCNIDILRQCGVPDQQITRMLPRSPRFFAQKPEWFKDIVARADEFGVKRDSGLFTEAVKVMGGMSKASIEAKFELYKSYGWSELDIISAFRKSPSIIKYSEQNIRATMSFLVDEVGCKPKDILSRPRVLCCSLEKVLKPRNVVLNILISRRLIKKKPFFISVAILSKEKFLQNYVVNYADKAPNLQQLFTNHSTSTPLISEIKSSSNSNNSGRVIGNMAVAEVISEIRIRTAIDEDIQFITGELSVMKACLKDAEMRSFLNDTQSQVTWYSERRVAEVYEEALELKIAKVQLEELKKDVLEAMETQKKREEFQAEKMVDVKSLDLRNFI